MTRVAYLSGALRVTTDPRAGAGGPRTHVLGVISALRAAGCTVDEYIAGDRSWARRLAREGRDADVRSSAWKSLAADGLRMAAGATNAVAAPREIRGDVDIAYERFGSFQRLGPAFQRRGATWVLETSGPFFHEAKVERGTMALTALARRTELAAYDRCDLLVCVSEALRSWLVDHGVRSDHTWVMPNAVDVRRFDPAVVPVAAPRGDLVVGFVGTVLAWQGLETLVRALAIARGRGAAVRAVVVGDGPALGAVRSCAAGLGVSDAISFTGQVPSHEIPGHIAGFDLGVSAHLPLLDGRMYHSPLKLYEYLAMGVPLLAADHPEARALVEGSSAGALFPAGDEEALAHALCTAADDVDVIRSQRAGVREYAVREHSWDARVAALLAEVQRRGR